MNEKKNIYSILIDKITDFNSLYGVPKVLYLTENDFKELKKIQFFEHIEQYHVISLNDFFVKIIKLLSMAKYSYISNDIGNLNIIYENKELYPKETDVDNDFKVGDNIIIKKGNNYCSGSLGKIIEIMDDGKYKVKYSMCGYDALEIFSIGEFERYNDKNTNVENKVNHPSHYGGENNVYEVIKVIEAHKLNFNLGNVLKYLLRAGKKDNIIQDLEKANWYLQREIKNLRNE
jgi:hypothetical protein